MTNALTEVKPFVYTSPQGLQLEVLFVLDPEKKGYINATAIAKQFGMEPYDWLKNANVHEYINALLEVMNNNLSNNYQSEVKSNDYNNPLISLNSDNYRFRTKSISYDDLVVSKGGHPETGGGTWLHPKLAVIFARWLSPHFAVWCDELITKLLQQHPIQQQQFSELAPMLSKAMANLEQRIVERVERVEHTTAQMLNRFHTQSAQDNKHVFGQIFNSINQINKVLHRQQADLLNPTVEVTIQQTLTDYQHSLEQMLQQMLHGQQDELIQGYLIGIKDNLERIEQRLVAEPVTVTEPVMQPVIAPVNLATEIAAFKEQGWSWNRIAQELNARGTATVSGVGQWHGSSVKRYLEAQK